MASAFAKPALLSMFIGDALAMPVHWYYDTALLDADYGRVSDYVEPRSQHPDAGMSLPPESGQRRNVVGDVILKGKRELWARPGLHYHYGLSKGENTLNGRLLAVLAAAAGGRAAAFRPGPDFLPPYVAFMTAEDSHKDTYAETSHRLFFDNFEKGLAPADCTGAECYSAGSIGGFGLPTALAVLMLGEGCPLPGIEERCLEQMRLLHRSGPLEKAFRVFLGVLAHCFGCKDLAKFRAEVTAALGELGVDNAEELSRLEDRKIMGSEARFSHACGIEDSLPGLLVLALKYGDNLCGALLADVNIGGDNVHRSMVLGALIGGAFGVVPKDLHEGLFLKAEIDDALQALP